MAPTPQRSRLRLALVAVAAAQYLEDTSKYVEVLEEETAKLQEELKSDPFIEEGPLDFLIFVCLVCV